MFLKRTFVMPSRMCINPIHNKKGILHHSDNRSSKERWAASSCAMDSLYDMDLISDTVPVILDNSKLWYQVLSTSMKLGPRGVAHVEGINRVDLKEDSHYSNLLLINRTASCLSWYKWPYSSNYSWILDPLIKNNYQLFIVERVIIMGAKTSIKTFKEDETVLSLTDDPKKNTKSWQIPVYTMDEEGR
ncbi:uncharacterized protein LOC126733408 [Quercus robur]|uniref:uncharacterized protein LOC126733408 n=1 Tax=Quercus robur TaxID=38942 RepID=UPI002162315D|nr:uncharacterized protein LOC126733408 [Quercus robur]